MPKLTRSLIALALMVASLLAARACDLRLDTYEDGSGKISWCLPDPIGDCSQ